MPRGLRKIESIAFATLTFVLVATQVVAQERVYTRDADFDDGVLVGVNHDIPDQLQLDVRESRHPFLWVAKSGRRSIVRIDANTGVVVGEYFTSPGVVSGSPSRTAVDRFGNVWVGNSSGSGSVAKIGVVLGGTRGRKNSDGSFVPDPNGSYLAPPFLYSTAVDRDGDGLIRTSRGLGDVLAWRDITDGQGGVTAEVEDAEDECILLFQRSTASRVLHVSLDTRGHAWIGGISSTPMHFNKLDAQTGEILETMLPSCGGYGGTVDNQGVLWSASLSQQSLMRYDTVSGQTSCVSVPQSAGVAVDTEGYIWNTTWDWNSVAKIAADGTMQPGFPKPTGGRYCLGVAVTPADNDVWVANKRTHDVSRLDSDGNVRKRMAIGSGPTGVAVDANGKIWVVNQYDDNVVRIDPSAGADGLGEVDLTVPLGSGARPLAYGNMTGMIVTRDVVETGSWTVVFDGGRPGVDWGTLAWQSDTPGSSGIAVHARAADEIVGLTQASWDERINGHDFSGTGVVGRWIEIRVGFAADDIAGVSPVLHELGVRAASDVNAAPDCANAVSSVEQIWPPDGRMVAIEILGLVDADGDVVNCTITSIQQDEPLEQGRTLHADAWGVGTATAYVRAKRAGNGNGRVYTISYVAADGRGGQCTGSVRVCVPHDMGRGRYCPDDAPLYDSTAGGARKPVTDNSPNPFNPYTTIRFTLPVAERVQLTVYNALGRRVATLVAGHREAGMHEVLWDGRDEHGRAVASGVYLYKLRTETAAVTNRMLLLE